jgi:hypothetical protein
MHSRVGVRQFIIKIFISVTNTMQIIILHIIRNSHVVVQEHSSVKVLRSVVESHIIPVRWVVVLQRQRFVPEGIGHWQHHLFGFCEGHFSFEVFILACVVKRILISHA